MFYDFDTTRLTFAENRRGIKSPPIVGMISKLLRMRLPVSIDHPNVDYIQSYEIVPEEMPLEILESMESIGSELLSLGFKSPIFHAVNDPVSCTEIHWATYFHEAGRMVARIHSRVWTRTKPAERRLFPMFFTVFDDMSFLVTSAGKDDGTSPPEFHIKQKMGATTSDLWEAHQEALEKKSETRSAYTICTAEELRWFVEQFHSVVRDHLLKRGLFSPRPEPAIPRPKENLEMFANHGIPDQGQQT